MYTTLAPRLLIVEGDRLIRDLFQDVLSQVGYVCTVVSDPEQALHLLHTQPVDLIVTNSFSHTRQDVLASSRPLLQFSHPLPVIMCSTWGFSPAELREAGFAGAVAKPFLCDELATTVAECLKRPFSATQYHQAEVIKRFLATLSKWDRDRLGALMTEDVAVYPWLVPAYPAAHSVVGRSAALGYVQEMARYFGPVRLHHTQISPCPHGLATRFMLNWHLTAISPRQQMVCLCFQFTDEGLIEQVGLPHQDEALWTLLHADAEQQPSAP
jgi:CheY-like chemotaxis protein